ncbi:ABC transporter permease [Priestia aryabhattai]|uniref:ABC transporter permease n=1 Tax=Priestia aryabhattai TaxID=412384 RepID=UPI002453083C|nr:ABC transporter permease [Priestia aryabhattai]MDH3113401.1 ABC transporter permease [Priestia aryabhattai]MDH3127693.1 ABC transporter permease [Priestia aryabhattai]
MLKLMKLEYKKHRLSRYIKNVVICILAIFFIAALMGWGSRNEIEPMYPDYADFMSLANIFIRIVFICFSSVILSRLIIDEYKNKTIQLLFTYPLQRKKLMQAKLLIVFVFCFVSIIIATFIIDLLIFWINPHIYLVEKPVKVNDIISTVPSTIIGALMMAGVSLIPLFFGMRKKSVATTITSSLVIGFLINATISSGGETVSLYEIVAIPGVLCLLGLLIGYLAIRKVDHIDIA